MNNSNSQSKLERLQKIIAATGILSRRKAEEAILEGRVSVNGVVVRELGTKADILKDVILLDGAAIQKREETLVLLYHKPRKTMVTMHDPEGRRTYLDDLPPPYKKLRAVGRLDFDSEGLLILTNHGEIANHMMHPRYGIRKIYEAQVEGQPTSQNIKNWTDGVELDDGPGKFEKVRMLKAAPTKSWIEIEVSEGRNRFVRRMCDALGHPVARLIRTRVGSLRLDGIQPGEFKILNSSEISALFRELAIPRP
jgi:pseudouridine synthase